VKAFCRGLDLDPEKILTAYVFEPHMALVA
jgi:hypothetical protein